jgi:predicted PurR-regulated permease PerM
MANREIDVRENGAPRHYVRAPRWQNAIVTLTGVAVAVAAAVALYWAQQLLIPVALAILITFLLAPPVTALQRYGLGRVVSAVMVVAVAGLAVFLGGWLFSEQIHELANQMPQYTENITRRVRYVRALEEDSVMSRLNHMAKQIAKVWNEPPEPAPKQPDTVPSKVAQQGQGTSKAPAEIIRYQFEPGPSWLHNLASTAPLALEILASAALTITLVIFMLLWREDLRNRVIWLAGRGRVALTTKALDDIGQRISHYLLTQLMINVGYGAALTGGLALIGVDHALLWGLFAGVLRYLPYLGAPIAALFPICMSLAQFEGWTLPLTVIALIVLLEVVTANLVEPCLFGKSIGVSAVAFLVAAGFWTFLWGPAGLLLSGPLTVCLVVVGEYVPALRFLSVLLSDRPALQPHLRLFQRLAAGDQDEALAIVLGHAKEHTGEQVCDGLLLPALAHVRTARGEGELGDDDERFIIDTMRMIIELTPQTLMRDTEASAQPPSKPERVLALPARDELDHLTLLMLQQLLDPARWDIVVAPASRLAAETLSFVREQAPVVVCVGSLPPGGTAHVRYLCKRLRSRFPDLKILVGRWMEASTVELDMDPFRASGADKVESTLLQMCQQLMTWLPVLEHQANNHNTCRVEPARSPQPTS